MSRPTSAVPSFRERFLAGRPFGPDPFQVAAFDVLDEERSVLVAAPTGAGKTVVAEYAVAQALERGERAFYTTPLKALSNQKYHDFVRAYGAHRVGLLTGDVGLNGGAPVVVMTTEVLRNMIYAAPERLEDLGCVVLDEVHYLEDRYRGAVWEEIILSAPSATRLVCLSATVSNAEELAAWITTVRGSTGVVIEEQRPIELRHLYAVVDPADGELRLLPVYRNGKPNPDGLALDSRTRRDLGRSGPGRHGRGGDRRAVTAARPRRSDLIERLDAEELLPAIYFIFSRAGCDDAVRQLRNAGVRLTRPEERTEIRELVDDFVDELSDEDLRVLRYREFVSSLEDGVAPHHAGMIPPFREAVEALFARALVKVVFATETLALGINMPARTVVVESLSKYSGSGHADLTPGEYTQLTGRAGRRGLDPVGYAAVAWSPFATFEQVAHLASTRSRALRSSFRPTYNMAVNLVRRYTSEEAHRLVRSSFAQYLSEVPLTAQFDAVLDLLGRRGYLAGWRVTAAGERLVRLYHDADLLLAEAIGRGLLDGLDPGGLAAVVSSLTYEARRASRPDPPGARVARRIAELDDLATELRAEERAAGLPRTRRPDAGFARLVDAWARGHELRELLPGPGRPAERRGPLRAAEMTGGDFVRNVKQVVDLCRQLALLGEGNRLGRVASQAAEALVRGVVAASSGAGHDPEEGAEIHVAGDGVP